MPGNLSHDFKKNARSFVINENMVIKNGFKKDVHYLDETDRDLNSLNDLYRISRYMKGYPTASRMLSFLSFLLFERRMIIKS
jgi:hypothetical protein